MAELLQRFSGNPFSTPVGQKIEQATDPVLNSENWALNMEICDLINETDDGARDAVRAIKKRLQQNAGKNYAVFMFALTVLETCVKNCSKRFHILVTNKDFVQELVKLIGPKNDPPAAVQEKVLSLIQSWAEAFHGQPELQGVSAVYNELRSKGVEFPKSAVEQKVPIHTPQRSISTKSPEAVPSATPTNSQPRSMSPPQRPLTATISRPPTSEVYPIHLSPEQLNKLKNELEVVQGNMKVLSDMLTEMKPGTEHKDDWELLLELHGTCQSMQKRIVELIEKVANEEVTNELLRINDELNNLFMRFERYQKKRQGTGQAGASQDVTMIASTSAQPKPAGVSRASNAADNVPSLIDFTDDEPDGLTSNLNSLNISQPSPSSKAQPAGENIGDQEFDMFAQLRSNTIAPSSSSNSQDLLVLDPIAAPSSSAKSSDSLQGNGANEQVDKWTSERPANTSNSQFEQFLQRRANALEQQPMKKESTFNQDSSLI